MTPTPQDFWADSCMLMEESILYMRERVNCSNNHCSKKLKIQNFFLNKLSIKLWQAATQLPSCFRPPPSLHQLQWPTNYLDNSWKWHLSASVAEVWRRAISPLESPLTLPDPAVDQCERSKAFPSWLLATLISNPNFCFDACPSQSPTLWQADTQLPSCSRPLPSRHQLQRPTN